MLSGELNLNGDFLNFDSDEEYKWFLNGLEYSKEEWFSKLTKEELTIALANPENF